MSSGDEKTTVYETIGSDGKTKIYYKTCDTQTGAVSEEVIFDELIHSINKCVPPENPDFQGGRRRSKKSKKSKKAKKTKKSKKSKKTKKSRKH